jgi:hypothetical protein
MNLKHLVEAARGLETDNLVDPIYTASRVKNVVCGLPEPWGHHGQLA